MVFIFLFQGAAKVSILTIGQQAIMDAYLCLIHLTAGILVGKIVIYYHGWFLSCLLVPEVLAFVSGPCGEDIKSPKYGMSIQIMEYLRDMACMGQNYLIICTFKMKQFLCFFIFG